VRAAGRGRSERPAESDGGFEEGGIVEQWFGWLWQRGRWVRMCGPHDSLSTCSRELGAIGTARGVPAKYQVMTGGAAPTFRPAGKRACSDPRRKPGRIVGLSN